MAPDGGDDRGVGKGGSRGDDGVGYEMVNGLCVVVLFVSCAIVISCACHIFFPIHIVPSPPCNGTRVPTECSSCFTSNTVPSWKVHFTTSVSGLVPFVCVSDLDSLDQKVEKSWSLIRCQTCERGAAITVDSVREEDVGGGPEEDMVD